MENTVIYGLDNDAGEDYEFDSICFRVIEIATNLAASTVETDTSYDDYIKIQEIVNKKFKWLTKCPCRNCLLKSICTKDCEIMENILIKTLDKINKGVKKEI